VSALFVVIFEMLRFNLLDLNQFLIPRDRKIEGTFNKNEKCFFMGFSTHINALTKTMVAYELQQGWKKSFELIKLILTSF
jgi:hypothetical protein